MGFYKNDLNSKKIKKKTETSADIISELNELKKLFDEGILTKEEFEKAKKKILN